MSTLKPAGPGTGVAEDVAEIVGDGLSEGVEEGVSVSDGVVDGVPVREGVVEGVAVIVAVAVSELEGVSDALAPAGSVTVGVTLAEPETDVLPDGDGVSDGHDRPTL